MKECRTQFFIHKNKYIHLSVLGQASEDINIDSVISSNTLKITVVGKGILDSWWPIKEITI